MKEYTFMCKTIDITKRFYIDLILNLDTICIIPTIFIHKDGAAIDIIINILIFQLQASYVYNDEYAKNL